VDVNLYEVYTEREDAEGREKYLKSGAGRRLLRSQLRHYLKKFPARIAQKASPRGVKWSVIAISHVTSKTFTWLPRLDSNQE